MTSTNAEAESYVQLFGELQPQQRAWALVGFYLQQFSALEAQVDGAIAELLSLGILPSMIVLRNVEFAGKVKVLRSLADILYSLIPDEEVGSALKRETDPALKAMVKELEERNVLAHSPFVADREGDGVVFTSVRVTSQLHFETVTWSISDFVARLIRFEKLIVAIYNLTDAAKSSHFAEFANAQDANDLMAVIRKVLYEAKPDDLS